MAETIKIQTEDVTPNPEFLIKAISEQGYTLEAALADLIDNSISAKASKVEVLFRTDEAPFTLYIADDGIGMDEESLKLNMRFPSKSLEDNRSKKDLGRFGLGMKTASFSQSRKFTVLSRIKGSEQFCGRTWDVSLLKDGKWRIQVNTEKEIEQILENYKKTSEECLQGFKDYTPNTIIVWFGLHKYEEYLEQKNRTISLKSEMEKVTHSHLSVVFHRFMESKKAPLKIRVNNRQLQPFNPFPTQFKDLRKLEYWQRRFDEESIRLEGFVLPVRSMDEAKEKGSPWVPTHKSLLDMEGIYIYRANRIILFGGWNGLIKKVPRLQLARLKVEIGNGVDHLLHLNVAKSQVIVPHDLQSAFVEYIDYLKEETKKEYHNRGVRKMATSKNKGDATLLDRIPSNKGLILEVNHEFPLIKNLLDSLEGPQRGQLRIILRMLETQMNKLKQIHEEQSFPEITVETEQAVTELLETVQHCLAAGLSKEFIKKNVLNELGYDFNSLPSQVLALIGE